MARNENNREDFGHFYCLDVLRGMAALVVVVWHWQHFFNHEQFHPEQQPFYAVLKPLYLGGWQAVDLFFCLSGFVFFWLYSAKIHARQTTAWAFAVRRFSRLYPLYFATLLAVAVAQWVVRARFGHYLVYTANDPYDFGLQLLMASNWGLERGASFNGPAWSVSVEVLLYAVFYWASRRGLIQPWHLALFVLLGYGGTLLPGPGPSEIGGGVFSFFMGGLAYHYFVFANRREISGRRL
jgi:peptidoglycan/LPS O-acetylase OafA/YrhL